MPTNPNMVAIQTVTVGAGGAASIDFTNIPQTYTDLVLKTANRSTRSATTDTLFLKFNNTTTSYSQRRLYAFGTTVGSDSLSSTGLIIGGTTAANATANTFSNIEIYIPNYAGSTNKSVSSDGVSEDNSSSGNFLLLNAGLWSNTSAINQITLNCDVGNFAQYSSATLYGVLNYTDWQVQDGAKARGGIVTSDANYWYHTFTSSASFTPTQNLTVDYLVVAGGGGGGRGDTANNGSGGGGGGGGLRCTVGATGGGGSLPSARSVTSGTAYTITVGAGGAAATSTGVSGSSGTSSSITGSGFTTITTTGGGGGGSNQATSPLSGGSGGGGSSGAFPPYTTTAGAAGTANEGYAGGSGEINSGGGGGGAGGTGNNGFTGAGGPGANGGNGISTSISGSSVSYAGGGGGNGYLAGGSGGSGGGGAGAYTATAGSGTSGTGGGGGGSSTTSGAGGSGIVIVRYAK